MQYLQESCKPAALLKRDSNADVFFWILQNFSERVFWRTSANGCFWFCKAATGQQWAAASVLTLLLSSNNLLAGYEQLSY